MENSDVVGIIVDRIDEIEYIYNPFKKRPVKGVIALLVLMLFAYLAAMEFNSVLMGVILFCAGFMSLSSFYFSARYRLSKSGVERQFLGVKESRAWDYFRSVYVGDGGILLSPFRGRNFLEKFRGFEIPFDGDNRLILAFVKSKIRYDR